MRLNTWLTGLVWVGCRLWAVGRSLPACLSSSARLPMVGVTVLAYLIMSPAGSGQSNTVLTQLSQVQALSLEQARSGYPVRLRVSVTYCDPEWSMMFIQDGTGSAYVERNRAYSDPSWLLQPGRVVLLEGVTVAGVIQANIRETKLTVTDEIDLPVPSVLGSEEAFHSTSDSRWVKASGFVTSVVQQLGTKSELQMRVESGRTVKLAILGSDPLKAEALRGYFLEVTGVLGLDLDRDQKPTGTKMIWSPGLSWVRKVRPIPITPIASLPEPSKFSPSGLPGRLRGAVINEKAGSYVFLRDSSGSVRVNFDTPISYSPGRPVEVIGVVERQEEAVVLNHAIMLGSNALPEEVARPALLATPSRANTNLEELTQVIQVRNLSQAEAARGHPVHITGVITYSDVQNGVQFVQDGSSGIYLALNHKQFDKLPAVRSRVEIRGFSGPGEYAPVIEGEQIRALGEGDFPAANPEGIWTLMSGSQDSQWVTVSGMIRHQALEESNSVLTLSIGNALLKVFVPDATGQPAPANFEDAFVEIQGVCATEFDDHRRLKNIQFMVPRWDQIRILDAAPRDAFALKPRALNELLEFQAGGGDAHRSHVSGVVSLCREDGSFYLQDVTGGVLIEPQRGSPPVRVGEQVELVGFPSVLEKLPVLQEVVVKPTGRQVSPPVMKLSLDLSQDVPLGEALNGRVVELKGEVLGHFNRTDQESLSVQCGAWITDVIVEKKQPADRLARVLPGSIVQVTGVFVPRLDDNGQVHSFQIWLRSPSDVTVLSRPSWWTALHTAWALGSFGVVLLLALTWVSLLRRQVGVQTRQLREEIEERKRMETKVDLAHQALVSASRQAGMAEVATSVLHNVGNVLNSVNISSTLLVDRVQQSRTRQVARVAETLREHANDLGEFLTRDPKGVLLVDYFGQLAGHLSTERDQILKELESLRLNIDHIKEIVAMQQRYAKNLGGMLETITLAQVVADAWQVNAEAYARHHLELVQDFEDNLPRITTDKHKVLQILINLLSNAKYACEEGGQPDKRVVIRVRLEADRVKIRVIDNGVGIQPENMTRIFHYGFTTRAHGHGFGLHAGSLAARELGGNLSVHSDGPGRGATFILELPLDAAQADAPVP